jgi:hypothetical protein
MEFVDFSPTLFLSLLAASVLARTSFLDKETISSLYSLSLQ